jgi:sucrose-6-phosphate hydrolase SacC (GH32 family)
LALKEQYCKNSLLNTNIKEMNIKQHFAAFWIAGAILLPAITAQAQSPGSKVNTGEASTFQEKYRPQYHLTTPRGALFDPTALVYVDGQYQVNKGIAKSTDLVHWKLGRAQRLHTDSVAEMSGSAVIDSANSSGFGINGQPPLVAVYSGLRRKDGRQYQCIAYSNDKGQTWSAYKNNPVIDIGSTEFRDPQVFWYSPQQKWVMVVALAAERKIRFYESANLKEWKFLSDFGPYGAVNGVWECPDLFRLPVTGMPGVYKWVLEVSVQPISGQYFVGDFDGRTFTADPDFRNVASVETPPGTVLFDFEKDLSGWKAEGDGFTRSPAKGSLPLQNAVLGYAGNQLLNSFYPEDKGTGKIMSPEFTIDQPFINFLIGGGLHEHTACINLIVDGAVVRTKTGTDTEVLYWTGWNVAEYKGKRASLQIVDLETGAFGHILIDQVMQSDRIATSGREKAHWVDYGPDFYAARSWVNGPQNDSRRVSVAWLGSWLYATKIPSKPWKGGHTFPRAVELIKTDGGIRLTQNPITEIERLRNKHFHFENLTLGSAKSAIPRMDLSRNCYELIAEFDMSSDAELNLTLCANDRQKTVVQYSALKQELSVDRTHSGIVDFSPSFPLVYAAPLKSNNKSVKLHILIDGSSIEVFGNNGQVNLTCQIFPDEIGRGINLQSVTGSVRLIKLDVWELNSIWQTANNKKP